MNETFNPKPMFYACLLENLRKIAFDNGYALAIHGSCIKDLDLIAIRWNEIYSTPEKLVRSFVKEISGYTFGNLSILEITKPQIRFENQIHYTIPIIDDWFVDLTVIRGDNK